jgi:hypothetical protein
MVSHLLTYLIAQKQIKFNHIVIHQITLNEIIDYGIDEYNMLMLPFLLDIDDFDIKDETLIQNMNIFDILLLQQDTLTMLLNSISFFCKTDKISFDEQKGILYIGDGYINRDNFAEFADIILKINAKQKIQKEKPPKNMTPKQQEIWDKLREGRQRQVSKSQIDLADLLNVCEFGGDYHIPINSILGWTMFNVARCYKAILGKSNYQELFDIYCVTGEDKLIKNQHWTDLIKIENDNKEE